MEIISWDHLNDYVTKGLPALLPVKSSRQASLFLGYGATPLGLRIPAGAADTFEPSPYREITIELQVIDGSRVVQLSTSSSDLFRKFYLFSIDILELLERAPISIPQAINISLASWGELLSRRSLMPETSQLGLHGELCFLTALIAVQGVSAMEAWVGPRNERHDFRIANDEFEVKSTRRDQRIHIIHGLGQLDPTLGKTLFVLSFHFELAGSHSGHTLPEKVSVVRGLLTTDGKNLGRFEKAMAKVGYRDSDAVFYTDRFQMRSLPRLIPVNGELPRITAEQLRQSLGEESLQRIDEVTYEINVDGLGHEEGSSQFSLVLPKIPAIGSV